MSLSATLAREIKSVLDNSLPKITANPSFDGLLDLKVQIVPSVWEDEKEVRIYYRLNEVYQSKPKSQYILLVRFFNALVAEITQAKMAGLLTENVIVEPPFRFDPEYAFSITQL